MTHSHIEYPPSRRLLKRTFSQSFDIGDSEKVPLVNYHQPVLSTLPPPSHAVYKVLKSRHSPAGPPSLPEPSRLSAIHSFQDDDTPTSRVEDWLEQLSSKAKRSNSCPPQIQDGYSPPSQEIGKGQPLSLAALRATEQLPMPDMEASTRGSSRTSRVRTSHPDYRKVLDLNGVHIDLTGDKIPPELRKFLDSHILKTQSLILSPEEVKKAVNKAVGIASSAEGKVHDLEDTALLPVKCAELGRDGNTLWNIDGLPRKKDYLIPLSAPKPDVHLGYFKDRLSDWKLEEHNVIDHPAARRLVQPAKGNCFPFFVIEFKSEAMGGSLWQAENQAAGSGACCVNAAYWLHQEAEPGKDQSVLDSVAFSCCATHRMLIFYIHFYVAKEDKHYMSWIATCDTLRNVQTSNDLVASILAYGLGPRQTKIRQALKKLWPIPARWKFSRRASTMDSQYTPANETENTNKSRRMQ